MTQRAFIDSMTAHAKACSKSTGIRASVIMAQWCDETGYGTSIAFLEGHNVAGISWRGEVYHSDTLDAGLTAYVETINLSIYNPVRAAYNQGAEQQAIALGKSPWAGGRYGGVDHPRADLVSIIESFKLIELDAVEPMPTPTHQAPQWNEVAAGHPVCLFMIADLVNFARIVIDRALTADEYHMIGTWAFEISIEHSTSAAAA